MAAVPPSHWGVTTNTPKLVIARPEDLAELNGLEHNREG